MANRRNETPRPADDDAAKRERYKEYLDRRLDEALEETFPASDPIAVTPRRSVPAAIPAE